MVAVLVTMKRQSTALFLKGVLGVLDFLVGVAGGVSSTVTDVELWVPKGAGLK